MVTILQLILVDSWDIYNQITKSCTTPINKNIWLGCSEVILNLYQATTKREQTSYVLGVLKMLKVDLIKSW